MKQPRTRQSISSDEQLARYAYVLGNVPASVADKAYAAAFAQLSDRQREVLLGELRAQVPDGADPASKVHPEDFALCMRDLHWRSALVRVASAHVLAGEFVHSPPIVAYFTVGAGSVTIDQQPPWIHEMAGHETAPIDGGRMHHRQGVNSGEWYV